MSVALVILPAWSPRTPPLGISYISASLKNAAYAVDVYDLNIELWNSLRGGEDDLWGYHNFMKWQDLGIFQNETFPLIRENLWKVLDQILEKKYDAIGFSVFDTSHPCTRQALQYLRDHSFKGKLYYGGPGVQFEKCVWDSRDGLIDGAIIGEGDENVVKLLDFWLRGGSSVQRSAGIYLNSPDQGVEKPAPYQPMELSKLPLPDFSDFNFENYQLRQIPIMMSRGCVAACSFCAEFRFWRRYRTRPAEHIFSEILRGVNEYGIHSFAINDSLVNGDHEVLADLAERIIERDLKIHWEGYARVDAKLTRELLEKLAHSGCSHLSFGMESGSQKVLDLMFKEMTVEEAKRTIRDTHESGIEVHLNMIVGFPNETEEDFKETLDFLNNIRPYLTIVNTGETLSVASGTTLQAQPKRFGIKTDENNQVFYDHTGNWISMDGKNTHQVRRDRLMRLRSYLSDLGVNWTPRSENF